MRLTQEVKVQKDFALYQRRYRRKYPEKFNALKKKNYAKGRKWATKKRRTWTPSERKQVMSHHKPDRVIARLIRRSVQAIQLERLRIKNPSKRKRVY